MGYQNRPHKIENLLNLNSDFFIFKSQCFGSDVIWQSDHIPLKTTGKYPERVSGEFRIPFFYFISKNDKKEFTKIKNKIVEIHNAQKQEQVIVVFYGEFMATVGKKMHEMKKSSVYLNNFDFPRNFPQEIWQLIVSELSPLDLIALKSVSWTVMCFVTNILGERKIAPTQCLNQLKNF